MLSLLERIKTWWTAADPKQRVVVLGGIGALMLLLVGTAFFVTRPHYKTLLEGLSDTEQASAVDALKAGGIAVEYGRAGTVQVPEGRESEARVVLAKAGKLPKGGDHWGKEDLTKANAFTSPGVEGEILDTVRAGEIASSLEALPGIASANVIVTRPKQTAFEDDRQDPTASVTIGEDGSGRLTRGQGRIVADLVCSAVQGMRPEGVTVVSNGLGEIWNGKDQGSSETKTELDDKVARNWETKLQAALDVPFGAGNTKVIVRADVDTSQTDTTQKDSTPATKPKTIADTKELMDGGTKTIGGPSGTSSNTQIALASPPNASDGKGHYENKGTTKEFPTNEREVVTKGGVGDLKGLAVTVVANSDKVPDATAVKEIVNGVMGGKIQTDAAGVPVPNQPFTTTVTSVKFDGSAAQAAREAADRLAGQQRMQQLLSILPIAAILAVALLVAKQVGRISKAVLPPPPDPEGELAEPPGALDGGDGPDALPAPAHAGHFDETGEPVALERFEGQVDVPLESLKQIAAERPEMVATLIKSVLLGERG